MYRVYNSDVSTDHAVTLAYELGSTDIVRDDALCLRNMIVEAFYKSKTCHGSQPMTSFGRLMSTELKTCLKHLLFVTAEDHTAKKFKGL